MSEPETVTESVSWTVRLYDTAKEKAAIVVLAALAAGFFGLFVLGNALLGIVGFGAIMAATAEFWLGVRYSIGPNGASARVGPSLTAIAWDEVKRVDIQENQIKLSPLAQEGRLDPFRGVTLRTNGENAEKVRALVKSYCGSDVRFLGN